MKKPALPQNEERRLEVLRSYRILDTDPEEEFDELIEVARYIAGTSISFISLVDENRQWFKSQHGFSVKETPREISLCGHVVADDERLTVNDLSNDDRFADNPVVCDGPELRFYSGTPLRVDGVIIGTLCVADTEIRDLSEKQIQMLDTLGDTTMELIRARRDAMLLSRSEHLARTIREFTLGNREMSELLAGFAEIGCDRFEADIGIVTRLEDGVQKIAAVAAPDDIDLDSAEALAISCENDQRMSVCRDIREDQAESEWGSAIRISIDTDNGFEGFLTLFSRSEMQVPFNELDEEELLAIGNTLAAEVQKNLARQAERQLMTELEARLEQIKTLHGLIPICSYCKQIRNDAGAWQAVERYVMSRSEARFSHGICPDCYDQEFGAEPATEAV